MKGIGNAGAQRNSAARVATVPPPTAPGPTVHVPISNPQADKLDVIKGLEPWVAKNIEPMLVCPKQSWQPADFLPDPAQPDTFPDAVRAFQRECAELPPELMVVLVGDMVTEEALPSYLSMLNRMEGTKDESGGSDNAWARWNRGWTSEENRHGDLLNKMLYLSGAIDMRAIEASIQHLLGTGFDPQLGTDAYRCFVYTSFQERATKISHQNTADLAGARGASQVHNACSHIAGDEARHEAAYQRIMDQLFQRSPDAAVRAFADMMRATIVMPAHLMEDDPCAKATAQPDAASVASGAETPFFGNFAALADSLGVYTARDYASIMSHLMRRWHITSLQVESGEAAEAQEYLASQEKRVWRMADVHMERAERQRRRGTRARFPCAWVHGRELQVQ